MDDKGKSVRGSLDSDLQNSFYSGNCVFSTGLPAVKDRPGREQGY